jgi:AraC-like DNA-binding protein
MSSGQLPKVYLYRRIVLAKLFIDEHFAEDIDLNDISGEAYFSKFHFIRLFRMAYGKTPHQYLTHVRIENAKLLLQTDTTVSDVCFSVGFDGISSFTKLFKRIVKITPSVYQAQQKARQLEMNKAPLKFVPGCFAEQHGWKEKSQFSTSDPQE